MENTIETTEEQHTGVMQKIRNRVQGGDRGAGLVEYAALIVLAVAILGALWGTGVVKELEKQVGKQVGKLFTPSDPGGE